MTMTRGFWHVHSNLRFLLICAISAVVVTGILFLGACRKGDRISAGAPHDSAGVAAGGYAGFPGAPDSRIASSITGPGGDEFSFEPLDGDGSYDKHGPDAYTLALKDGKEGGGKDGSIVLTISTNKEGEWKYVLGYIHYNPEHWNPVGFERGGMWKEEKELGVFSISKEKGRYAFCIGLLNFDKKDPKKGGDICSITFENTPWDPPKTPSIAPHDLDDKVFDLHEYGGYDNEQSQGNFDRFVIWGEVNRGDGNLDSNVDILDTTPLMQYFGHYIAAEPTLDPIDYDDSGYIGNAFDYTTMWYSYQQDIDGYVIKLYPAQNSIAPSHVFYLDGPDLTTRLIDFNRELHTDPDATDPSPLLGAGYGNFWNHNGAVGYAFSLDRRKLQTTRVLSKTWWITLTPFNYTGKEVHGPYYDPDPLHPPDEFGVESNRTDIFLGDDNRAPTAVLNPPVPSSGAAPLQVSFDASPSHDDPLDAAYNPPGQIVWYEWDWDGPANGRVYTMPSHNPAAIHTYLAEGTYDATVRVTDDEGGTDRASFTIRVGYPPNAVLTATPNDGNPPLEVSLDASGSTDSNGTIEDYEWDFDGDNIFNETDNAEDQARGEESAPCTFPASGDYTAAVRVTDNDGLTDTASVSIHVNWSPVPNLTITPDYGKTPLDVDFDASGSSDQDGTIEDYEWDFDGDTVLNENDNGESDARGDPTPDPFTFASAGTYFVGLRVTDDRGLASSPVPFGPITVLDHLNELGFKGQTYYPNAIDIENNKAIFVVEIDCYDNKAPMWYIHKATVFFDTDNPERINWDSIGSWPDEPPFSWSLRLDAVQAMDNVDSTFGSPQPGVFNYLRLHNPIARAYCASIPDSAAENPPSNKRAILSIGWWPLPASHYYDVPIGSAYGPDEENPKGVLQFRFSTELHHGWSFDLALIFDDDSTDYYGFYETVFTDWSSPHANTSGFYATTHCYIP